jgi:predicted transcriptional regulator
MELELSEVDEKILDALSEDPHTRSHLADITELSTNSVAAHLKAMMLAGYVREIEDKTALYTLVADPRDLETDLDELSMGEFEETDHQILDLLAQGPRTKRFLLDLTGMSTYYINTRIRALKMAGMIREVEDAQALYEIIKDPRPASQIGATLDEMDVPTPPNKELQELDRLQSVDIYILDYLNEGKARTINFFSNKTGHNRQHIRKRLNILSGRGYVWNVHETTSLWQLLNDPRPDDEIGERLNGDSKAEFERLRRQKKQNERDKTLDLLNEGGRTIEYIVDATDLDIDTAADRLETLIETGSVEQRDDSPRYYVLVDDRRPDDEIGTALDEDDGVEHPERPDYDTEEMDPEDFDDLHRAILRYLSETDSTQAYIAKQYKGTNTLNEKPTIVKSRLADLERGGYIQNIHPRTALYTLTADVSELDLDTDAGVENEGDEAPEAESA